MKYDKVIIGCGNLKYEGDCLHIDYIETRPDVFVWDLNDIPWPLEDEITEEVIAKDIIEHLDSVIRTMEECHRILVPGGTVTITTPHYTHQNSWHDPTHKWHLSERSFEYFDPETNFGSAFHFYTEAKFETIRNECLEDGNIFIVMKAKK